MSIEGHFKRYNAFKDSASFRNKLLQETPISVQCGGGYSTPVGLAASLDCVNQVNSAQHRTQRRHRA